MHTALSRGASTYESLVAGIGQKLVHSIYGTNYFDYGDGDGIYTAKINGQSYIHHMLTKLSEATLPVDTECLQVKTLKNRHTYMYKY